MCLYYACGNIVVRDAVKRGEPGYARVSENIQERPTDRQAAEREYYCAYNNILRNPSGRMNPTDDGGGLLNPRNTPASSVVIQDDPFITVSGRRSGVPSIPAMFYPIVGGVFRYLFLFFWGREGAGYFLPR